MHDYSRIVAGGRGLVVCLSVGVATSCGGGGNAPASTPVSPSTACVYTAEPLTFTFYSAGGTGQFTVTTAGSSPCGWYAEESANSEDWISVSGSSTTIYGNGTKIFTVKPGDTPAGYPAPRDGEIFIRKAETNEILITIAVAQVDPILGTWSGTIAACGEPEPGETCIATEPRLFTVTFDSSIDSSPYSYFWTDITTGTRYSGAGMNWESTQSGNTWFGSADGVQTGQIDSTLG